MLSKEVTVPRIIVTVWILLDKSGKSQAYCREEPPAEKGNRTEAACGPLLRLGVQLHSA